MSLSSQSIVNNDTDSSAPGNTIMVKKPGADSLVTKLDTRIAGPLKCTSMDNADLPLIDNNDPELEAELKGYKGKGNSEETHDADFVVSTSKNVSSPRLRINLAGRKSLRWLQLRFMQAMELTRENIAVHKVLVSHP